jgi:hypothetical protein
MGYGVKVKYWDRTRASPGGINNSPCNIERGIMVSVKDHVSGKLGLGRGWGKIF